MVIAEAVGVDLEVRMRALACIDHHHHHAQTRTLIPYAHARNVLLSISNRERMDSASQMRTTLECTGALEIGV